MSLRSALRSAFRRFRRDESGSITVEAVLMIPILVWVLLASFVFFNSYRQQSLNLKVAYTLTDIVSRETNEPITPEFVDSLFRLQGFLLGTGEPQKLRLSLIRYTAGPPATYRVVWSQERGWAGTMTNARLNSIKDKAIPLMSDGEVAIILETSADYTPAFRVGIGPQTFTNFMVMRPRFNSSQFCWANNNDAPWPAQVC
ncbi:hypothetical protein FHG66_03720 [Rubellimicrobium rubrum]|uniref:Pilus assembly protein n=1 Tax=Rubellimicrobium rubrum TaxID=2585369 RepID=A0A5C4N4I3_9RHOB|nr:hypothetical protein [Rubellimicrobium rubrum]TNC51928.1 hypothetical protein FHG66_03720 [Rubellimicrobium rubrum]